MSTYCVPIPCHFNMTEDDIPPFLTLPSELIHQVLSYLPLSDLISVSEVNRILYEHAIQDTLWHPFVQDNVRNTVLSKPASSTWRHVYSSHHPYWFIPRNKIWFADKSAENPYTGKLLIARYDHRLDRIEAYSLGAERGKPTFSHWDWNPDAIIHTFTPHIKLDLNSPVIQLDAEAYARAIGDGRKLQKEIPMDVHVMPNAGTPGIYSHLMLTRTLPPSSVTPNTRLWPPSTTPSPNRCRNESPTQFRDVAHRPSVLSELSTSTFRLRKWVEFSRSGFPNVRVGEDVTTFATLPEECYTPTKEKPFQGIWCGDYAGHGVEFLVFMQPDDPKPLPERAEWTLRAHEREGSVSSGGSWSTAPMDTTLEEMDEDEDPSALSDEQNDVSSPSHDTEGSPDSPMGDNETVYQGRIEAVKLTGDPNIPRGEYTFIAPDIGPNGLLRVATEEPFKGARIVRSVGHIAARGFRDDDFMLSQLILISENELAQYWETFGHVSYYRRVDIDQFTKVG